MQLVLINFQNAFHGTLNNKFPTKPIQRIPMQFCTGNVSLDTRGSC